MDVLPSSRPRNIRRSYVAEELGVLLLRGIAAVAQVDAFDDFGIDAIATLLREDGADLFAEDSFYVQLKAASVSELRYTGHQIDWLARLELPFFVGSVNLAETSISLYTGHSLHMQFPSRSAWDEMILVLGEVPSSKPRELAAIALPYIDLIKQMFH